jgi:transposase
MIKQKDWVMIRNLYLQGMKKAAIARLLGINRKTVSSNLKKEESPVYERLVEKESKLEPYKEYTDRRLEEYDLTAVKLYGELQEQGYTGKYSLIAAYVGEKKKELRTKAVLRFETLPGEQAQVDWGYFGNFYDREQKKTIKLYCFFMILGYSRALYIEFFERADIINFLRGHNNAFRYFGGYTKELLYDNLKSVVIKRALRQEESQFNKKFLDFAGYYGFKPILCRPYRPTTKGKVENSVLYAKQNFFSGEEFISLRDLNEKALVWLERINQRIHCTTKQQPFERLKRESLITIKDKKLYDTSSILYRQVFKDCHFSYGGEFLFCAF